MPRQFKNLDQGYMYDFIAYDSFRILAKWINKENREAPNVIANKIKAIADLNH